jgi:electron-transferring-flavoprotein dehydrogenase
VEVYPGFAAAEVLYDETGAVRGVATGDMGVGRDGQPGPNYISRAWSCAPAHAVRRGLPRVADQDPVRALRAAARARAADLRHRHQGAVGGRPGQARARQGHPHHRLAAGHQHLWRLLALPLREQPGGRGFRGRARLPNPHLSPFDEMQRFKTHPAIRPLFEGGKRIAYGARAIARAACSRCRSWCSRAGP